MKILKTIAYLIEFYIRTFILLVNILLLKVENVLSFSVIV